MNHAMRLKVIRPFFSDVRTITTIKSIMDKIEADKLGYEDYAQRTGLIWSDVSVNTRSPIDIIEEFATQKATLVNDRLKIQQPQSLLKYAALKSIVCAHVLPKMFEAIGAYKPLPEQVYAQFFFQRCSSSKAMDWHQDPGEDYTPQADYSLVLMLSDQNDPDTGWNGGVFNLRPGLPTDTQTGPIESIIPRYNQGILFDNQANSHAVTEVLPLNKTAIRDLVVITMHKTQLPIKKDE